MAICCFVAFSYCHFVILTSNVISPGLLCELACEFFDNVTQVCLCTKLSSWYIAIPIAAQWIPIYLTWFDPQSECFWHWWAKGRVEELEPLSFICRTLTKCQCKVLHFHLAPVRRRHQDHPTGRDLLGWSCTVWPEGRLGRQMDLLDQQLAGYREAGRLPRAGCNTKGSLKEQLLPQRSFSN